MTFRQLKAKVKTRRTLMLCAMLMTGMGVGTLLRSMRSFQFTMGELIRCSIAYAISMAGALIILVTLKYNREHTKCPKCRRQIDISDFMNMENFKCTHCGFAVDADDEIW